MDEILVERTHPVAIFQQIPKVHQGYVNDALRTKHWEAIFRIVSRPCPLENLSVEIVFPFILPQFAIVVNGVSVNKEGGYYCRGRQYGVEKKLAVGDCYENKKQLCGGRLNLMEIAREHKVSKMFVRKIEGELYEDDGRVIYPEEVTLEMVSRRALGPGSIEVESFYQKSGVFCLHSHA